jgi:O-acetylhomoserine (thiol)-lyase
MTSPWLFVPKTVGASLVVNALTKYIGGHGNALGGCITDTGLYDWRGYPHIYDNYRNVDPTLWGITQIRKKGLRDFGAALGPEAAHHLSVGADTLGLRMDKACANALAVAQFCAQHPKVRKVFYPGLPSHPQHDRAKALFRHFGALLSIELANGVDCFDFLNALDLVICSSNLGDTRSLGIPVAHTIYWEMGAQRRASMGVADSMVRLSIGIEDTADLLADFAHALA